MARVMLALTGLFIQPAFESVLTLCEAAVFLAPILGLAS